MLLTIKIRVLIYYPKSVELNFTSEVWRPLTPLQMPFRRGVAETREAPSNEGASLTGIIAANILAYSRA